MKVDLLSRHNGDVIREERFLEEVYPRLKKNSLHFVVGDSEESKIETIIEIIVESALNGEDVLVFLREKDAHEKIKTIGMKMFNLEKNAVKLKRAIKRLKFYDGEELTLERLKKIPLKKYDSIFIESINRLIENDKSKIKNKVQYGLFHLTDSIKEKIVAGVELRENDKLETNDLISNSLLNYSNVIISARKIQGDL